MPDEPKPDALRPVFRLRTPLTVPAGWPPDVAPNQIITAAHINAIKSSVYAWPGNVDGQNHTLSNVNLVNATGVLADPTTTPGDLIARGATAIGRFGIGAAGQVLTVDLAAPAKLKWATPAAAPVLSFNTRVGAVVPQAGDYTAAMVGAVSANLLTTKGDLIAFGTVTGRMPVGTDGQVLRVDSAATPFGLRWAGESVPSVFTRTGPIVAQAGDYTAAMVTNAVSSIATYPDPAWITSLSWAKLIGVPATFTPAAHTHAAADIVSGVLATARLGTGVADATVYLRGDGTWAAAGTGGGGGVVSVFGRAGNVIAQSGDYTAAMVGAIPANLLTSTGDLLVRNNVNALTRLPIGANGQVLQTDLATSVGMKWTSISASVQTPWVTNIDAAAFNLTNVGRLGVALAVPNYPVDVVGDINYTGVLRSNGVPVVFGGSQTPWTQNINASGFSLNNAGTVGIGVAAPQAAPIQVATHTPGVAGSLAVQDLDATTSGNPVLLVTGLGSEGTRAWAVGNRGGATYGKDLYVWNDRSSDMLFGTNSAERMRITAAGLVGIGVTPTYPLDVKVAGFASQARFYGQGGTTSNNCQVRFAGQKDGELWAIGTDIPGGGSKDFHFYELSAATRMILQSGTGNVGIGTNPASILHCFKSQGGITAITVDNDSAAAGVGAAFRFAYGVTGVLGGIYHQSDSGFWAMRFKVWSNAAEVERVTIKGDTGAIGMGTTNPLAALHVAKDAVRQLYLSGVSTPTNQLRLGFDVSNNTGVVELFSGGIPGYLVLQPTNATYSNVGIGTTSPQAKVDIYGHSLTPSSSAPAGLIRMEGDAGGNCLDLGMYPTAPYGAWLQATDRNSPAASYPLVLQPLFNNVGIGNANPSYKLDVSGDVNCTGAFRVNGAACGAPSTRNDVTGSRGADTTSIYQNNSGKPMFVSVTAQIQGGQFMHLRTDAGNPPNSVACAATNAFAAGVTIGGTVSGWVMPGHFYRAYTPGATLTTWLEWT